MKLTPDEEKFIEYWENNRFKQKKFVKYLQVGLPLGVFIAVALAFDVFSGWYRRAQMALNTEPSLILVLLVAVVAIAVFISIFTVRYRFDQNEQRYRELLAKKNKP
ncbi:MAG: hypothetical protein JSU05_04650 [Bacteroidetes bacterium]|nr:hypothetical protein [Bacteroidota bacterium]